MKSRPGLKFLPKVLHIMKFMCAKFELSTYTHDRMPSTQKFFSKFLLSAKPKLHPRFLLLILRQLFSQVDFCQTKRWVVALKIFLVYIWHIGVIVLKFQLCAMRLTFLAARESWSANFRKISQLATCPLCFDTTKFICRNGEICAPTFTRRQKS